VTVAAVRHRLRSALGSLAAAVDRLVAAALVGPRLRAAGRSAAASEPVDLAAIQALYDRPEHYGASSPFFAVPELPVPRLRVARRPGRGAEVLDARWPSCRPFDETLHGDPRFCGEHHDAAARLFLHRRPASTAVVLVHGYLGGSYAVEEHLWAAQRLHDRGLDVALAALPFHGVRALRRGSSPPFPASDPRITNEGVRQAIHDLRGLLRYLHARGTRAVGAMGMSLGGYTTALLATLEPELAFAVPMVPLADLTDFARGRLRSPATYLEACASSSGDTVRHAAALRVTSPLTRPAALLPGRVLVVGAAADRIAPISHARDLAAHFSAPLQIFPGGHLMQLGRGVALRAVDRLIADAS
jgi:dienelactone hydrolase